jgi:hypothetical protein
MKSKDPWSCVMNVQVKSMSHDFVAVAAADADENQCDARKRLRYVTNLLMTDNSIELQSFTLRSHVCCIVDSISNERALSNSDDG